MLAINQLSFDSLFSSALPSYVRVTPTNPFSSDTSTADTIALMDSHALAGASHPLIQDAVEEIRANAASEDEEDLIEATYEYVQEKVTFCEDEDLLREMFGVESGVELLITPPRLLSMHNPKGDCDDFSMLTKSLLYAQGIDTSLTTIAADRDNPKKWSHVYLTNDSDGKAIDASHGKYVGWEAPLHDRKTAWVNPSEKHNRTDKEMIMNNGMGACSLDAETGVSICWDDSVTPSAIVANGGRSFDWTNILAPLTRTGSQIAIAQFGQPQLAPGTFIKGADGSLLTNQPITGGYGGFGSSFGSSFSSGGGGIGIGTLAVVGVIIAALAFKH